MAKDDLFDEDIEQTEESNTMFNDTEEIEDLKEIDEVVYTATGVKKTGKKIKADALPTSVYLDAISNDYTVCKNAQAEEKIIKQWLGLVYDLTNKIYNSYIAKYSDKGTGVTYEDVESFAMEGLVRAIRTYDPERSTFSTYAHMCIRHMAGRAFLKLKNNKTKQDVLDRTYNVSLDETVDSEDDGTPLYNFIADESVDFYKPKDDNNLIYKLIILCPNISATKYMLFKLNNSDATLRRFAETTDVSYQRIQQIYAKTTSRMQSVIKNAKTAMRLKSQNLTKDKISKEMSEKKNAVDYYLRVYNYVYGNGPLPIVTHQKPTVYNSVLGGLVQDPVVSAYFYEKDTSGFDSKKWYKEHKIKGVDFIEFNDIIQENLSYVNKALIIGGKIKLFNQYMNIKLDLVKLFNLEESVANEYLNLYLKYESLMEKAEKEKSQLVENEYESIKQNGDEKKASYISLKSIKERINELNVEELYDALAKVYPNDYRMQVLSQLTPVNFDSNKAKEICSKYGYDSESEEFKNEIEDAKKFADKFYYNLITIFNDENKIRVLPQSLLKQYTYILKVALIGNSTGKPSTLLETFSIADKIEKSNLYPNCDLVQIANIGQQPSIETIQRELDLKTASAQTLYYKASVECRDILAFADKVYKLSKTENLKDVALKTGLSESGVKRHIELYNAIHYNRPIGEHVIEQNPELMRTIYFMYEPHKSLLESVLIQNKPISKVSLESNESPVAIKSKFKAAKIKLARFRKELTNAKTSYITEDKPFRQKISVVRTERFFASLNKFILGKMEFLLETRIDKKDIYTAVTQTYGEHPDFKLLDPNKTPKQLSDEFNLAESTITQKKSELNKLIEQDLELAERMFYFTANGMDESCIKDTLKIDHNKYLEVQGLMANAFKSVYKATETGLEVVDIADLPQLQGLKFEFQPENIYNVMPEPRKSRSPRGKRKPKEVLDIEIQTQENSGEKVMEESKKETSVVVSEDIPPQQQNLSSSGGIVVEDSPIEIKTSSIDECKIPEVSIDSETVENGSPASKTKEQENLLADELNFSVDKVLLKKLSVLFPKSYDVQLLKTLIVDEVGVDEVLTNTEFSKKDLQISIFKAETEILNMLTSLKKWKLYGESSDVSVRNEKFYNALDNYLFNHGSMPKRNPFETQRIVNSLVNLGVPHTRFKYVTYHDINGKSTQEIKKLTGLSTAEIKEKLKKEREYIDWIGSTLSPRKDFSKEQSKRETEQKERSKKQIKQEQKASTKEKTEPKKRDSKSTQINLESKEIFQKFGLLFFTNLPIKAYCDAKVKGVSSLDELRKYGANNTILTEQMHQAEIFIKDFLLTMMQVKKERYQGTQFVNQETIAAKLNLSAKQVAFYLEAYDYLIKDKAKPKSNILETARIIDSIENDLKNEMVFPTLRDYYIKGLSQQEISNNQGIHTITVSNRSTKETKRLNEALVNALKIGERVINGEKIDMPEVKSLYSIYRRVYLNEQTPFILNVNNSILENLSDDEKELINLLNAGKKVSEIAEEKAISASQLKPVTIKLVDRIKKQLIADANKTTVAMRRDKEPLLTEIPSNGKTKSTKEVIVPKSYENWDEYRNYQKERLINFMGRYLKNSQILKLYYSGEDVEDITRRQCFKSVVRTLDLVIYSSSNYIDKAQLRKLKGDNPNRMDLLVATLPFDRDVYYDEFVRFFKYNDVPNNVCSLITSSVDQAITSLDEEKRKEICSRYMSKNVKDEDELDYGNMLNSEDEDIIALYPIIKTNLTNKLITLNSKRITNLSERN